MPIQVTITNGPPFKGFLFLSMIVSNHGWIQEFHFDGEEHPKREWLTIINIGQQQGEKDADTYSFLAHCQCGSNGQHYFYAGRYNTRDHTGTCTVFTQEEFTMCPVVKAMFV